jgi:hypothetical protein
MPNDTALKFVLQGQVVTMDDAFHVLPKGAVYVDDVTIAAVQAADAPPPAGFANAPVVATKGTIYPGMIELHNHLSYDALTLWNVPKKYDNRDQWPNHPEYHQLVTGPMSVLGTSKRRDLLAALVRYVESKCLFGGVTTSQGIKLSSNAGVQSYYKGVVRNVEHTGDKALPAARTHVADVAAKDWQKFLTAISGDHVMILHLAEGKDTKAREHFLALKNGSKWAITNKLVGIHWRDWQRVPAPGFLHCYTYWMDMRRDRDGNFWGNMLGPAESDRRVPPLGKWLCVEQRVALNTPGKADGELAVWVDGQLYEHYRGFRWRSSESVSIKRIGLQVYVHEARRTNRVWIDDLVVSTGYVGLDDPAPRPPK